ncbi:MAG: alpha/beta fold hydrolase [Planctomycetota bacterium]
MSLPDAFADFIGSVRYAEMTLPWGPTQVWDMGEGPPVVLLHGIAAGRRVFFRVTPQLAGRYRVIVPPLRGDVRPAPHATHDELVNDLEALLDALDLENVTLVGTSFGGTVALAYAARRDPRVTAVVVQGTFRRFGLRPFDRAAHALSYLFPARLGAAYYRRRVRLGPENRLLAELSPGLDVLLPDWSGKTPFPTLRRRIKIIAALDLAPALGRIDVPLTFAHGTRDKVVPRTLFEELKALRPDACHLLWEGVGHNAALTHPERVVEAIATSPAPPGA